MTDTQTRPMMPSVILETERLRLRAFVEADIDDVFRTYSDPAVQRWVPIPAPGVPYTREIAEHWCREAAPALRTSGDGQQWAAVEKGSGRLVGAFGLLRTQWPAMITEIGYAVSPWARGLGYATEAAVAVSRWAVDQGFQRVELKAAVGNTASRRVAVRAGFSPEGVERNAMPLHEGRTHLAVYSLLPADLL
nr:GNAT family N-acetyltransferase [Nocardiopsis sp. NRRL B-16309]